MKPRIYTIATTHLDTSWSWDLETTLNDFLPKTPRDNFELFEKYPEYVFSFEGSYRYELLEEYYPELFERVRELVLTGRWNVSGSSYENGDVNIPSPEALLRNILYGNGYLKKDVRQDEPRHIFAGLLRLRLRAAAGQQHCAACRLCARE